MLRHERPLTADAGSTSATTPPGLVFAWARSKKFRCETRVAVPGRLAEFPANLHQMLRHRPLLVFRPPEARERGAPGQSPIRDSSAA